ncbi:hypothetical protein HY945_05195 [Candidatus Gottesmanbacteria bacterium]|nr:hypothetical protein [Candidatus Gottesmanbacteria bacterium]
MKSFLSKFMLLTACYLLLTTNIYAQEITATTAPTPATPPQLSTYGQSLSDFISNLVFGLKKNRIEQLGDINRGMLPPNLKFTTFESQEGIKLQGTTETQGAKPLIEARPIYKATEDYTIVRALRSPAKKESLSTNLVDFFAGLVKNIADVAGIAKIGDQKAEELVRSYFPPNLDIQSNKQESMMERGLPYLWCGGSPKSLCQDNKPRWAEENNE